MMIPCRFRQIFQDESDRFHQLKPTDLAQIAKVYAITARTSPSELVWQVFTEPNRIGQDGLFPNGAERSGLGKAAESRRTQKRRKRRKANRRNAERRRKDFFGVIRPKKSVQSAAAQPVVESGRLARANLHSSVNNL